MPKPEPGRADSRRQPRASDGRPRRRSRATAAAPAGTRCSVTGNRPPPSASPGPPPTSATTPASSCGATEPAASTRGPPPSTRFSLNPANWHATRRHDIGQFHGVSLHARFDDTAIQHRTPPRLRQERRLPDLHRPTRTHRPDRPGDVAGRPTQRRRRRTRRAPRPSHRAATPPDRTQHRAGPVRTMTTQTATSRKEPP